MAKLIATNTGSYAQRQPHLPIIEIVKGKEYDIGPGKGRIPEEVAKRIVELDGGRIVTPRSVGNDLDKAVTAAKKKVKAITTKIGKIETSIGDLNGDDKVTAEAQITGLRDNLETAQIELMTAEDAAKAED